MLFDFGDHMCQQKEDVKLKMLERNLTCDFKKPQDYPYMCPCANKKRSMCCTYNSNPWRPGAEATTRFLVTNSTHRECLTRFPMKSRPQVLCNGSMAHFLTLVSLRLCAFITSQKKIIYESLRVTFNTYTYTPMQTGGEEEENMKWTTGSL